MCASVCDVGGSANPASIEQRLKEKNMHAYNMQQTGCSLLNNGCINAAMLIFHSSYEEQWEIFLPRKSLNFFISLRKVHTELIVLKTQFVSFNFRHGEKRFQIGQQLH